MLCYIDATCTTWNRYQKKCKHVWYGETDSPYAMHATIAYEEDFTPSLNLFNHEWHFWVFWVFFLMLKMYWYLKDMIEGILFLFTHGQIYQSRAPVGPKSKG